MDQNDLRLIITVALFIVFIGIVAWSWSARQKQRFDEAAHLPFAGDDEPVLPNPSNAKERA
ncbi:MAG: CcoQ/FixQ family Cbb3-type cytochrome c oxidase assembly chaperone [Betaproteobacteria bacterium]|nr:CcoQ/FixQ family Cbb3-type cytochrome c oxidase assembly chaperone [Betaproteobacteria bacterium]